MTFLAPEDLPSNDVWHHLGEGNSSLIASTSAKFSDRLDFEGAWPKIQTTIGKNK